MSILTGKTDLNGLVETSSIKEYMTIDGMIAKKSESILKTPDADIAFPEDAPAVVPADDALPADVALPTGTLNTQKHVGLSKEDKERRLALLQEKWAEMKKKHAQEILELQEEIDYQRELLRYRREQKSQEAYREKLHDRFTRLCRKVEDDLDFDTDDESVNGCEAVDTYGADDTKPSEGSSASSAPSLDPEDPKTIADDLNAQENENDIIAEPNVWPVSISRASQEWEEQKKQENQDNAQLDSVMSMVGIDQAKTQFMLVKNLVDIARRQGTDLSQEALGAVFMGSPGTGKTTVATLYARLLSDLGIVAGDHDFVTTTGASLADGGVSECQRLIESFEETHWDKEFNARKPTRVFFVDEAHTLTQNGANTVLHYLNDEMRRLQGSVVFLFAGPLQQMQNFLGLSPSLRTLVPFTFKFDDFTDGELHRILHQQLQSKFQNKMLVEGGINGLYMRILIRRIGRGRGSGYFANAREVQNAVRRVLLRQANRLNESRRLQEASDDMLLTATDLIGPQPLSSLEKSAAWTSLQETIGLDSVKQSVHALITRLQTNYDRELAEKPLIQASLNRVFIGNPGTGKTTVARHYARILTDLGLLSDGEVIVKSCHDFIGQHLGDSQNKTKAILDSARGKVLIIDEAYGLARDDVYTSAVVDTIVAEVQATAVEDRAVLLLGYKDEMEEMFQRVNPGLGRRFPLSSAFEFHDYSDDELRRILDKKLHVQGFTASEEAKLVAMQVLSRSRNHRSFGNASEVDILLERAMAAQQVRLNKLEQSDNNMVALDTEFAEQDFDADFDRHDRAEQNIRDAFANLVGAEKLVARFEGYRRIAQNAKDAGLEPRDQIPFNFVFRGPPGTGKTTTARKMGQIFFDLGFLATTEVEVCSASDLIGEYVGHTGPKTQKVFQRALGKVLLIDEAYLLSSGPYGKEAVGELVNIMTLPRYRNRLVTILAGYNSDIDHLLNVNPGFRSRFPEVVDFINLSPRSCQELLIQILQGKKLEVSNIQLPWVFQKVQAFFQTLSGLPGWANARDVETVATSIFGRVMSAPTLPSNMDVPAEWIYEQLEMMITERRKAEGDGIIMVGSDDQEQQPDTVLSLNSPSERHVSHGVAKDTDTVAMSSPMVTPAQMTDPRVVCDVVQTHGKGAKEPGVLDETWRELKERTMEAEERRNAVAELDAELTRMETGIAKRESHAKAAGMDQSLLKPDVMSQKLSLQKTKLEEMKSRLEEEEKTQQYLMGSGECERGFRWIREGGGYRCAGGTHFLSHGDISRGFRKQ